MRPGPAFRRNGTTRYLATLVSALQGLLPAQFQAVSDYMEREAPGARPLGVHLEGPYIAPGAIGGFSPEQITTPEQFSMKPLLDEGGKLIRIMMAAPELPGSISVIEDLRAGGIVAAVGHTLADEAVYNEARRAGATHCTHTYNWIVAATVLGTAWVFRGDQGGVPEDAKCRVVKKRGPPLTAGYLMEWEEEWAAMSIGVERSRLLGGVAGVVSRKKERPRRTDEQY